MYVSFLRWSTSLQTLLFQFTVSAAAGGDLPKPGAVTQGNAPVSFRLLVGSSQDLVVVNRPSSWTFRHMI